MPRHTAHALEFSYHEARKHHPKLLHLNDLPDGSRFFDLACDAWVSIESLDERRQRSFQALPAIKRGATALMIGRVGHYGAAAQIRDVHSGEVVLNHEGNLANEPEVRLVLAVPPTEECTSAFMIVEEINEGSLKAPYLKALKRLWSERFPDFTLDIDNVAESDGWLKTAELAQVTVTYRDQPTDLADHSTPTDLGVVRSTVTPGKGRRFSRRTYELLSSNKNLAGRLVGRSEDDEEPDSVTVTMVGTDDRKKTFAIGNERTPMARWVFSDFGQPPLDNTAHLRRSLDEVRDLMRLKGTQWDNRWEAD